MSIADTQSQELLKQIMLIRNTEMTRDGVLQATADLLVNTIEHYAWAGFYLVDASGKNLILGPYNGAPTEHTRITFGAGICGQVAQLAKRLVIQDVSLEDNYLSCSPEVRSEIVFPILKQGNFVGELDIDSHQVNPFTTQDTQLLERICLQLSGVF